MTRSWLYLGIGSVSLLACSGRSDPTPIGTSTGPLAAFTFTMFDRVDDKYTLPVCFTQYTLYPPNGTSDWAGDKQRVQDALTATWQAYSAVQFQFNGDCPAPSSIPADWMPIELQYDSTNPAAFGGHGQPGKGARLGTDVCFSGNCQVHFTYGSLYKDFQTAAVHEVGHALGFRHEFSRTDWIGCWDFEANSFDGDRSQIDYNTTGPPMTANVDLESVMSKWECYDSRVHGRNYYLLTNGDQMAVNFIYPVSFSRGANSIGSAVGFHTSSGTVVRSDGSVTTDWMASGAASELFSTTPSWYVWSSGTPTFIGSGMSMPASTIAAYAHDAVSFSFTDYWNRSESGQDNVVVDSTYHAALLNAVTDVLTSS